MDRLKDWLKEHRLTQTQFAAEMGITTEHANRVLNGNMTMSDKFRWRFGEVYGFDAALELLREEVKQ